MDTLIALVQYGPTGAGLAFSLVGYWLLLQAMKQPGVSTAMLKTIRYFITLSTITFALGLTANLLVLFFDPGASRLMTARLNDWDVKNDEKLISFGILADNLDLSHYVPRAQKDGYRLIVAMRPRSAIPNDNGSYPQAFGEYAFDSFSPQVPTLNEEAKSALASKCIDMVLFRVTASRIATTPLKAPFKPSDYGNDLKVLNGAYIGDCP